MIVFSRNYSRLFVLDASSDMSVREVHKQHSDEIIPRMTVNHGWFRVFVVFGFFHPELVLGLHRKHMLPSVTDMTATSAAQTASDMPFLSRDSPLKRGGNEPVSTPKMPSQGS